MDLFIKKLADFGLCLKTPSGEELEVESIKNLVSDTMFSLAKPLDIIRQITMNQADICIKDSELFQEMFQLPEKYRYRSKVFYNTLYISTWGRGYYSYKDEVKGLYLNNSGMSSSEMRYLLEKDVKNGVNLFKGINRKEELKIMFGCGDAMGELVNLEMELRYGIDKEELVPKDIGEKICGELKETITKMQNAK